MLATQLTTLTVAAMKPFYACLSPTIYTQCLEALVTYLLANHKPDAAEYHDPCEFE